MKVSQKIKYNGATKWGYDINNKYLIEIRHIARTIPAYYYLTQDEIESMVSDALISFLKSAKEKQIDLTDYHKYKNWQFIIVKNEILGILTANNTKKRLPKRNQVELNPNEQSYTTEEDEFNYLVKQDYLNKLTEQEIQIVELLMQGYIHTEVAHKLGLSKLTIWQKVQKIKRKLFPNFKPGIRKYETRKDVWNTKRQPYVKPIIDYDYNDFYAE